MVRKFVRIKKLFLQLFVKLSFAIIIAKQTFVSYQIIFKVFMFKKTVALLYLIPPVPHFYHRVRIYIYFFRKIQLAINLAQSINCNM